MERCIVCGHDEQIHAVTRGGVEFCASCCIDEAEKRGRLGNRCDPNLKFKHHFKLDNLRLIEDVAKERNLI